ncbi:MAG: hypothetical protein ACKV0T_28555 [Planctomycetales bacterium]
MSLAARGAAAAIVAVIGVAGLLAGEPLRAPTIRFVPSAVGQEAHFEVAYLDRERLEALLQSELPESEAWCRVFDVHVVDDAVADQPPLAGRYSLAEGKLRFTPKFPLLPGLTYRGIARPDALRDTKDIPTPAKEGSRLRPASAVTLEVVLADSRELPPPAVAAIYPSAPTLPENHLRFYIHFATPMRRGEAYDQIQLLRENGQPVALPFLELGEELWDASGQRLTLLIDPGRIKRGVKPREEEGPVFEVGGRYALVVAAGWHDAAGRPLAKPFRKEIRIGPPIHQAIDPAEWKWTLPAAGSLAPLVLRFPQPLDHGLLQRTLTVQVTNRSGVKGRVAIAANERQWEFRPEQPWDAGDFELAVATVLEDVAGNRIGRAFEVEGLEAAGSLPLPEIVRLPFVVSPAVPRSKE